MSTTFEAIYEGGVFRPIGPIALPEQTRVKVSVQPEQAVDLAEKVARQKAAIARSIARSEELTRDRPNDGWSARDHDRVLYGEKQ